jgi:hypothetical protein
VNIVRKVGNNQKLRFPPKTLASNISMLEPIQDNDNYKSHAKNIQIYPCLLKLSHKQESVTDGQTDGRWKFTPFSDP